MYVFIFQTYYRKLRKYRQVREKTHILLSRDSHCHAFLPTFCAASFSLLSGACYDPSVNDRPLTISEGLCPLVPGCDVTHPSFLLLSLLKGPGASAFQGGFALLFGSWSSEDDLMRRALLKSTGQCPCSEAGCAPSMLA